MVTEYPIRIAVVIGSTRPGRRSPMVAEWVRDVAVEHASKDSRAVEIELVDIADAALPLLDEPIPAAVGEYQNEHTRRWAARIAGFDGFIFVTPEYNHSVPASLKNAIDYLYDEWTDKAAGFVSYGTNGGIRAVEHLRNTLAEVKVAGVRSQVALGLFNDFKINDIAEPGTFTPGEHHVDVATRMMDELLDWATALRGLRERAGAEPGQGQTESEEVKNRHGGMQPPLNQPIGFWTAHAGEAIRTRTRGVLAEIGMSQPEWWLLHQLSLRPSGASPSAVIETIGPNDTDEAIEGAIGTAEEKRWLVNDGAVLRWTDAGAAQFKRGQDAQGELQAERMQGISKDDYVTTIEVLQRTIENVGGHAWHW
ncbi:MAG: NAD(P)H-dependent oxidoreductase [Candidatus Saccharibacteria bacterium]|nr:NAD(P)H-dependent oxidoreductase [Microbacteriaceae bacterium]